MKYPLLRNLSIIYLILPSFIFLYGWVTLPFAIISLLSLTWFILDLLSDSRKRSPFGRAIFFSCLRQINSPPFFRCLIVAFIIIFIWLAFSGTGGFGFQNDDYRAHNALLKDLIVQEWPITSTFDNTKVYIVYYVGYFLPAAVIGKAFGWILANVFQFLWTMTGVMLAFGWFWKVSRFKSENRTAKIFFLATIFCLAGGLDYVGYYILHDNYFSLITHIEFWAGYFQYSSNTTLLYWVPQHTIAPWLITGMVVYAFYYKHNLNYLGMIIATGILWSPFGVIGIVPYFLPLMFIYLQPQYRGYLLNLKSIIFNFASIGIACIYLLYLGSNQFAFPMGFIWQFTEDYSDLVKKILAFEFLEFIFLGILLVSLIGLGVRYSSSVQCQDKKNSLLNKMFDVIPVQLYLFLLSIFVLGLLPLTKMGFNNDLVMRGSIPSLFVFWAFTAKVVTNLNFRIKYKFITLYCAILLVIIIGFFPSIAEIARSMKNYDFGPPSLRDVPTTKDAYDTEYTLQRFGNAGAFFYRYIGKK